MKYGFLFGAGAEIAYNLPSGGQFALDIFRQDLTSAKDLFCKKRNEVNLSTSYACEWLPNNFKSKQVSVFGKTVFQNIITSTVKHRRAQIIEEINRFDEISDEVVLKMNSENLDVNKAFKELVGDDVDNIQLSQTISYNDSFQLGNNLFKSNYFSALLTVYRDKTDEEDRDLLRRILLSIMQLQLGALSENLSRSINENLFLAKDEKIDLFDDFGELISINYYSAGVGGLELLHNKQKISTDSPYGIILKFALLVLEHIYASILDYKNLIDSNWHYLYSPQTDWAKFCKIVIFLYTVYFYITELGKKAVICNEKGYYNVLRAALDSKKFIISGVATTNYNNFIEDILGCESVTYLNGSVSVWYDPYLNKIGKQSDLDNNEHHITVPLLFTQSGTKPMTSISMSQKYVSLYEEWKNSDAIVVVGFGFGADDEHINGLLRTLVNDNGKKLIVVALENKSTSNEQTKIIAKKLKISDRDKIKVISVDKTGMSEGKLWVDLLE